MTRAILRLTGTTPLLCHNIQLSDPDNIIVQRIAEITAKKSNKTEQDRRDLERLEYFGSLYTVDGIGGPVLPTANVRKCLIEAAKVTRQGKQIGRGVALLSLHTPILYDGPRDPEVLCVVPEYRYRASVNRKGQRVMTVRPQFPAWELEVELEIIADIVDRVDVELIAKRAGLIEGLGDNRTNGFGRFTAEMH